MRRSKHTLTATDRRLHPVSMLYFLTHSGKELAGLLPLIPVCIVLANNLFGEEVNRLFLTGVIITNAIILLIVLAWLRWRRFLYRVEQGVLYIEHGLWIRQKLWISKERISSLDTSISIYDRLFGLIRLKVETAGGNDEPEAVLSSITVAEAARIQAMLGLPSDINIPCIDESRHKLAPHSEADVLSHEELRMSLSRTLIMTLARGKLLVIWFVIAGGGLKLWDQWLRDTSAWAFIYDRLMLANMAGMITIYVILTWILAFMTTFFLDYGFRLEVDGDKITIERGFLEKKRKVIKTSRIQAVRVTENVLHQIFGMVSVRIVMSGSSEEDKKTVDLFPLVRVSELPSLLNRVLPDFTLPKAWNLVSKKGYGNYVVFPSLVCLIATAAAIVLLPTDWRWLVLFFPIVVWWRGVLEFKNAAWSQEGGEQLAIRFGSFSRQQVLIPRSRVQWHRSTQTLFQEGKQIATLRVNVASSKSGAVFLLRHAPVTDVHKLFDWLSFTRKRSEQWDVSK
ncbi:PH domain-containing protein [Paenibacillus sp. FSL W8-0426]|uniref:PH domain-containing protein n=1 Tax=Paenibacillus sp. FSL W8-0426 TaxID=2921714 RepID=UPI0030DA30D8